MGMIACTHHGTCDIGYVSPRVAQAVRLAADSGTVIGPKLELHVLTVNLGVGVQGRHYVDREFLNHLEATGHVDPGGLSVDGEEGAFEVYGMLDFVCIECLGEWEATVTREQPVSR